jgi:hypothetical protein
MQVSVSYLTHASVKKFCSFIHHTYAVIYAHHTHLARESMEISVVALPMPSMTHLTPCKRQATPALVN